MVMPTCVVEDIGKVFKIGQEQYDAYKWTRFVIGIEDVLNTKLKMNQLNLPQDAERFLVTNPLRPLTSSDAIKLRSGCSSRPELIRLYWCSRVLSCKGW